VSPLESFTLALARPIEEKQIFCLTLLYPDQPSIPRLLRVTVLSSFFSNTKTK